MSCGRFLSPIPPANEKSQRHNPNDFNPSDYHFLTFFDSATIDTLTAVSASTAGGISKTVRCNLYSQQRSTSSATVHWLFSTPAAIAGVIRNTRWDLQKL
jgi:hypothetical protein